MFPAKGRRIGFVFPSRRSRRRRRICRIILFSKNLCYFTQFEIGFVFFKLLSLCLVSVVLSLIQIGFVFDFFYGIHKFRISSLELRVSGQRPANWLCFFNLLSLGLVSAVLSLCKLALFCIIYPPQGWQPHPAGMGMVDVKLFSRGRCGHGQSKAMPWANRFFNV